MLLPVLLLCLHAVASTCNPGSVLDFAGGGCIPCGAGWYALGGLRCRRCADGMVSDVGSSLCARPGSKPCGRGEHDSGLAKGCVRCPPGHYKRQAGAGTCLLCPVNSFSATQGAKECVQCRHGEVSPPGSAECVLCPAGTFAGNGVCTPCPEGSWAEEGSARCSCKKGWTTASKQGVCTKCPRNTFKSVSGKGPCSACPFDFVSPEASEAVIQCEPADMLTTFTSGVSMVLKGVGVIGEAAPERRWRQQATENGMHQVSQALTVVYTAYSCLEDLFSTLHVVVVDLFESTMDFYRHVIKTRKTSYSLHICSSKKHMKQWLASEYGYNEWRRAVSAVRGGDNGEGGCRAMRRSARNVLMLLHPDKFSQLHPDCPRGASSDLTADFLAEYEIQKQLCAGFRSSK